MRWLYKNFITQTWYALIWNWFYTMKILGTSTKKFLQNKKVVSDIFTMILYNIKVVCTEIEGFLKTPNICLLY